MQRLPETTALDLAALLASKVCHDLISPIGAIGNGLELLDDDADEETAKVAMELVRASSASASAKLKFARVAWGAAGSAGAEIDTGDAEAVARGWFAQEKKTALEWRGPRSLMPKNRVKLMLNLLLVAMAAIPRGGRIEAVIEGEGAAARFVVTASGTAARVPPAFLELLAGRHEGAVDAHIVQPLYTLKLAEACAMAVTATLTGDAVAFRAG